MPIGNKREVEKLGNTTTHQSESQWEEGNMVLVGKDEGRWPKGTRVKKTRSEPDDTHQDGASGTIVGALGLGEGGPVVNAELIVKLAGQGIKEGGEYMYWVEWDDIPGIPVAIMDFRIEPIKAEAP